MISSCNRKVDENCAALGYYEASSVNSLPTSRGQPIGPIFQGKESKKPKLLCIFTPFTPFPVLFFL
jgi:hypothetical protein